MKNLFVLIAVGMMSTIFTMPAVAGGCSNQSSVGAVAPGPVYGGGSGIVYHGAQAPAPVVGQVDGFAGTYSGSNYFSSRGVDVGAGYGGVGTFGSPSVYRPRGGSFYRGSVGFGNGFPGRGFGYGRNFGYGYRGYGGGVGLGF